MSRLGYLSGVVFFILSCIVFFGVFIIYVMNQGGAFLDLKYHGTEEGCQLIGVHEGVIGPEDAMFEKDLLFISSDPRHLYLSPTSGKSHQESMLDAPQQGNIIGYNITEDKFYFFERIDYSYPDFHPHGIYLAHTDRNGKDELLLYVVNHRREGDFIEIFEVDVDKKQIKHLHSLTHESFRSINDVVAAPNNPSAFYVTTWQYYPPHTIQGVVEQLFQMPWTYINYCEFNLHSKNDKLTCQIVAADVISANGINLSPDGSLLYVASLLSKSILIYEVIPTTTTTPTTTTPTTTPTTTNVSSHLRAKEKINTLNTGCDNLDVDKNTGDIWCAAHPQTIEFIKHAAAPLIHPSPSQVLRIRKNPPKENLVFSHKAPREPKFSSPNFRDADYKVEEILLDDGSSYSGSSVAIYFQGKLYIGSVFDSGILVCDKKDL